MRRILPAFSLLTFSSIAVFAACSSDDPPISSVTPPDASRTETGVGVDGSDGTDGGRDPSLLKPLPVPPPPATGDGGAGDDAGPPVEIVLTTIPDSPCVARGGTVSTILTPDAGNLIVERLYRAGTRWVAQGESSDGVITFGDDGAGVTAPISFGGVNRVGVESAHFVVAGGGDGSPLVGQRFASATGASAGDLVEMAAVPPEAIGVIGGSSNSLAIWAAGQTVVARSLEADNSLGGTFVLGSNAYQTELSLRGAFRGGEYLTIWSSSIGGVYHTRIARASSTGPIGAMTDILLTNEKHAVVDIEPTPTGYVALLTSGQPSFNAYLLFLGPTGQPTGVLRRYLGSIVAYDLATQGSELGLLTGRKDDVPVFRPLDATGMPLGAWVCLETAPATPSGTSFPGALHASGTGYAAVFRKLDSSLAITHFDHLGTGAP